MWRIFSIDDEPYFVIKYYQLAYGKTCFANFNTLFFYFWAIQQHRTKYFRFTGTECSSQSDTKVPENLGTTVFEISVRRNFKNRAIDRASW